MEEIRDSFLALGRALDLSMGGNLLKEASFPVVIKPEEIFRRTVYIPVRRSKVPTILSTFDFGDATTSSEGRSRTNVAPQALS